jgi:hypothetical protein
VAAVWRSVRGEQTETEFKTRLIEARASQAQKIDREDRENLRPPHIHIDPDVYDNFDDVHVRPTGNTSASAHRRLRKSRPDIHSRVLAGELTPNAGMVEADFRQKAPSRKKSSFEKIAALIQKHYEDLTPEERIKLKEMLSAYP